MSFFSAPLPISSEMASSLEFFSSREESLNAWLTTRALRNEASGASRTYVVQTRNGLIAGYFSLSSSNLAHAFLEAIFRRNMPDPIPVILLGRLAVDTRYERAGLGSSMVQAAIKIAYRASSTVGTVSLATEALSESAKSFYLALGFQEGNFGSSLLLFPLHKKVNPLNSDDRPTEGTAK